MPQEIEKERKGATKFSVYDLRQSLIQKVMICDVFLRRSRMQFLTPVWVTESLPIVPLEGGGGDPATAKNSLLPRSADFFIFYIQKFVLHTKSKSFRLTTYSVPYEKIHASYENTIADCPRGLSQRASCTNVLLLCYYDAATGVPLYYFEFTTRWLPYCYLIKTIVI